MYHEREVAGRRLCESEPGYVRYVVGAEDFRRHVARLRDEGSRGLSVSEGLSALDAGESVGSGAQRSGPRVVFTFDDGCETDFTVAAPLLAEAGFGATFYVTVAHLGRRGYMSERQLRELSEAGFEIGSHALTHSYLHDLPDERVRAEVAESKERLEQLTGRGGRHFSCPGGRGAGLAARRARGAVLDVAKRVLGNSVYERLRATVLGHGAGAG